MLLAVTGRAPALQRGFTRLSFGLAVTGLAVRGLLADWREIDTVAVLALLSAGALVRRDFTLAPLQRLAPVGTISFGLYVIATPLQLGQRAFFSNFSGSALTFSVRFIAVVLVAVGTAWLIERRLCPPLGRWIRQFGSPPPH